MNSDDPWGLRPSLDEGDLVPRVYVTLVFVALVLTKRIAASGNEVVVKAKTAFVKPNAHGVKSCISSVKGVRF